LNVRNSLRTTARKFPIAGRAFALSARVLLLVEGLPRYVRDWSRYRALSGSENLRLRDADPRFSDALQTSPYDSHYLHQAVWAAERIFAKNPSSHVDIGSELTFVGVLSAKLPVTFVDLRPLELDIAQLRPVKGDILSLPFEDQSIPSLSSLHVVEHIGLGRYGDPLNPLGTQLALQELQRVVAPSGDLFLTLPIGRSRVCFNAHRVHDPRYVIERMDAMEVVEFSAVDDEGRLILGADIDAAAALQYGCGFFWLRRRSSSQVD
jgi:uncharacterized protein DUF268